MEHGVTCVPRCKVCHDPGMLQNTLKAGVGGTRRPDEARTITLLIVAATLASSGLSAFLFGRLSDEQHHVARIAVWYLYGSSMLSIFGGIGAWMVCA